MVPGNANTFLHSVCAQNVYCIYKDVLFYIENNIKLLQLSFYFVTFFHVVLPVVDVADEKIDR